jgi:hypothetical protein
MNRWLRLALVSLVIGFVVSGGRWAFGQAIGQIGPQGQAQPMIITGGDIGFRVDRPQAQQRGKVTGAWVVRINGEWVEPNTSGLRPLSTR